jgi:hypothetical protein
MWDCIAEAFKANLPYNLDLWIFGIVIGCVVGAVAGAILAGPVGVGAAIAVCAAAVGITLIGSALVALAQAVWDCL